MFLQARRLELRSALAAAARARSRAPRRSMDERGPWEAEIRSTALARAPFPKLVVSGAHHAAFDAICDVLERDWRPSAPSCPGAGHAVQRRRASTTCSRDFLERASDVVAHASSRL